MTRLKENTKNVEVQQFWKILQEHRRAKACGNEAEATFLREEIESIAINTEYKTLRDRAFAELKQFETIRAA